MIIQRIKNFSSRLLNVFHNKSRVRRLSNFSLKINEFNVTNVECLGISKLGNLSWKGRINKNKVKIVETFNNDHAKTVYEIMCLPDLREFFPQPFFRADKYIVLEWEEGNSLDKIFIYKAEKYIEELFWIQHTLHTSLSKLERSYRYNYFNYLTKRYLKYAGPFNKSNIKISQPKINIDNIQQRFFLSRIVQ